MNTKLILALAIAAAPAMAAPALTKKPLTTDKAITLAVEHTMYNANNAIDIDTNGITLRFDKVLAPMKDGNYWSWNVGGSIAKGEVDGGCWPIGPNGEKQIDLDTWEIYGGVDANFTITPRTTIFVGPRIGYATYEVEDWDEDFQGLLYGFNVGVRYKLKDYNANVEVGFRHTWYEWSKAEEGNTEANSIYVGVSIGF